MVAPSIFQRSFASAKALNMSLGRSEIQNHPEAHWANQLWQGWLIKDGAGSWTLDWACMLRDFADFAWESLTVDLPICQHGLRLNSCAVGGCTSCVGDGMGMATHASWSQISSDCMYYRGKERDTERERERPTDRPTNRRTDGRTDRHRDRKRKRQKETERDRKRQKETERNRKRHRERERGKHIL